MNKILNGIVIALLVIGTGATIVSAKGVVPTSMPVAAESKVLGAQTGAIPTSMPMGGGSVLGQSTYQFTRTLSLYAKGEDVRQLQKWLNANGYAVATSGVGSSGKETIVYGRAIAEAVKKLQLAHGLKADGVFGVTTRALVNA